MLFGFVALFLSILLTTFNRGFFSLPSFSMLLALYIILLLFFFKRSIFQTNIESPNIIAKFLFFTSFSIFIFFSTGIYQTKLFPSSLLFFIPLFSLPIVLTYFIQDKYFPSKSTILRFAFLIFVAFFLRVLVVFAAPSPIIDVFTMLKEAPFALLSGQNPYSMIFSKVYQNVNSNYFTYWPFAFLSQVPFVYFFHDPRILLIIADILNSILIYFLGRKTRIAEYLSLIYLFRPNSIFIIEQSWLTSLSLFLIFSTFLVFEKKKRFEFISGILLSFLVSLKPHYFVLFPLILFLAKLKKVLIASFLTFLTVVVLPFIIWNFHDFISDTIMFYLKPTEKLVSVPTHMSLNFNSMFFYLTKSDLPITFTFLVLSVVSLAIYYRLLKKQDKKHLLSDIILSMILVLLSLYINIRFAFINYYYFVSGLIILWLTVMGREKKLS